VISIGNEVDIPHIKDVKVKPTMQEIKKFLRPIRLDNQPESGSTIPLDIR
jgi:hypothetical protein